MRLIRRTVQVTVLVGLTTIGVACSDLAAPKVLAPADTASRDEVSAFAPPVFVTDTLRVDWVYQPRSGGTMFIGDHRVAFPARSICDPVTSGYGPAFWDKKCEPAAHAIHITAKSWTDAKGHPHIDFAPALRFVPGKKGSWVILMFKDRQASDPVLGSLLNILYEPGFGLPAIDESLADKTMQTHLSVEAGTVHRRIKHFSGYDVSAESDQPPRDSTYTP